MTIVEKYRPSFHYTPRKGWMNDPNGLVYFDGEYHLFYQHDNYDRVFQNMSWGHAISTDLVHWEEYPKAIVPDDDGLGMIFSGSAVVDKNNCAGFGANTLIAFYTSTNPRQQQCMAYSTDKGRTWTKYSGNPVIKNVQGGNIPNDFRDPKVIWHEDSQKWIMSLAVQDHIDFWSSRNLKDWEKESEFGHGSGSHNGVWECPDLFELEVDGDKNNKKWVLIVSINPGGPNGGSATQYFIGDFKEADGKLTFISDQKDEKWIDYGTDNYAGVTWFNIQNKVISIGWMSNWSYADKVPTENWRGAMTIPRELKLKNIQGDIIVTSEPIEALQRKFEHTIATTADVKINSDIKVGKELSSSRIKMKVDIDEVSDVGIEFSNRVGENIRIGYNLAKWYLYVDRSNSGKVDYAPILNKLHKAKLERRLDKLDMEIFVDKSSVEVFFNGGEYVMTEIIFPTEEFSMVKVYSDNKTEIREFQIESLSGI
ncbi:glycoside hydrolase family 32 protein [Clostridium thermarum]|uniref:glycoside hydrolase family 32 protein n=1 Tax=Clostridium thermarum TaxID=1716543 RepID=UPI0011243F82|nr:glycoside hydrolase family 32 protein [Clostridium thermarum]